LWGATPTARASCQHQERFRQAVLYWRLVMADPDKKADYEPPKAKGKPLFSLTVADFFNASMVDEIDLSKYKGTAGNSIVIRAHDDFKVTRLLVAVSDTNGAELESGEAVETPPISGRWVYTATSTAAQGTSVRVAVTVNDQPGGKGEKMTEKTL
jgi:hypothetical protein